jgi:hypothetical protein
MLAVLGLLRVQGAAGVGTGLTVERPSASSPIDDSLTTIILISSFSLLFSPRQT